MIREKAMFSFVALETVSVMSARPELPNWNQTHINGSAAGQPEEKYSCAASSLPAGGPEPHC
jgi:hypothetical protein